MGPSPKIYKTNLQILRRVKAVKKKVKSGYKKGKCNSGAPWLSKSTHPRKFGNHVTLHRPPTDRPSAPQENQCLLSHIYLVWEPKRKLIVHQCCDQLTAIKTGHPLTGIT